MTADQILNTIPFGVGVAASARIGNLLGSKQARAARVSTHASVLLATGVGSIILVILMLTKDQFGLLFSDDEEVVGLVSKVLPYVAAFQVADGMAQR
jgi:MATE family multidrug resistance protein